MSAAPAAALLTPSSAQGGTASEGTRSIAKPVERNEKRDFDRHLGAAGKAEAKTERPSRPERPSDRPHEPEAPQAPVAAPADAPSAPAVDAPPSEAVAAAGPALDAAVLATDLAQLAAQGLLVVLPTETDPLASAVPADPALLALPGDAEPVSATLAPLPGILDLLPQSTGAARSAAAAIDAALAAADDAALTADAVAAQALASLPTDGGEAPVAVDAGDALAVALARPTTGVAAHVAPAATDAAPTGTTAAADAGTSLAAVAPATAGTQQRPREESQDDVAADLLAMAQAKTEAKASAAGAATSEAPVAPVGATTGERGAAPREITGPGPTAHSHASDTARANPLERAVANQVARALVAREADGSRTMVVRLTPPELGTVRVEIIERAGVMTARLSTEDEAVRAALEKCLPQLKQDLRANDAPVRDVSLSDSWNDLAQRQTRDQQQGGQGRRRREGEPAFAIDGPAPLAAARRSEHALGGRVGSAGVDARA